MRKLSELNGEKPSGFVRSHLNTGFAVNPVGRLLEVAVVLSDLSSWLIHIQYMLVLPAKALILRSIATAPCTRGAERIVWLCDHL